MKEVDEINKITQEVINELTSAKTKFGTFTGCHEAYAVILEELDELWDEIKANRGRTADARSEAIQIAAMAMRYILDISDKQ